VVPLCENDIMYIPFKTTETVASKYNLICDDSARINDANTIGLAGFLAGAFVFGTLSDM